MVFLSGRTWQILLVIQGGKCAQIVRVCVKSSSFYSQFKNCSSLRGCHLQRSDTIWLPAQMRSHFLSFWAFDKSATQLIRESKVGFHYQLIWKHIHVIYVVRPFHATREATSLMNGSLDGQYWWRKTNSLKKSTHLLKCKCWRKWESSQMETPIKSNQEWPYIDNADPKYSYQR